MVKQFSFWLPLIVHCLVISPAVNAELAFVRPNSSVSCASSSQQPCLTFNEYAQQVEQYFVNDITFLFLPGTHQLNIQLNLEDLSNIALVPLNGLNAQNVRVLLSPSVNITWTNCENINISGFVFFLSGEFSVLVEFDDLLVLFSSELIFQGTTASLTNLTLAGDGTRVFAYCNSSDIWIGDMVAAGIKATILYASYGAVEFYGNYFC